MLVNLKRNKDLFVWLGNDSVWLLETDLWLLLWKIVNYANCFHTYNVCKFRVSLFIKNSIHFSSTCTKTNFLFSLLCTFKYIYWCRFVMHPYLIVSHTGGLYAEVRDPYSDKSPGNNNRLPDNGEEGILLYPWLVWTAIFWFCICIAHMAFLLCD